MKRLLSILTISFLTASSICLGQSTKHQKQYIIDWKQPKEISLDNTSKTILTFTESTSIDNTLLPYFIAKIDLAKGETIDSIQIINPTYSKLDTEEKLAVLENASSIKSKIETELHLATERKNEKAIISLLPIINENGELKKLTSFSLQYKTSTTKSLRSTNTGSNLHSFATSSVLGSGKWVKISVTQSGIHKITYEDLVAWGVSNPANANIFGYGGAMLPESFQEKKKDDLPQLSIFKEKGSDGVFGPGDYMLFHAQGPYSWKYDSSDKIFKRIINPYSFTGYYFVSSDVGSEKLIQNRAALEGDPTISTDNYLDHKLYEQETTNIISSGREWYGETYANGTAIEFTFPFNNITATKQANVYVSAAAKSTAQTSFAITYNNTPIGNLGIAALGTHDLAVSNDKSINFTPTSDNTTIKTTFNGANGNAWLNYITVNAYRNLILTESAQYFRCPDIVEYEQFAQFELSGNNTYKIWNITDPANIKGVPYNFDNNIYSFLDSADVLKEYVAVNTAASFPAPSKVGVVANQNLHALAQTNFIIITSPEFVAQATTLAKKHEQIDGISTAVVTAEQIYNEFSSGTPDATAYRWFIKMFYDRAQNENEQPKSLLLFGDGTYDNRSILKKNATLNKLLTYQSANSLSETHSYVCDDYFGLLDDNEGALINYNYIDLGIGRIPASTSEQASSIVSKISNYLDNNQKGNWKNLLCFLADDGSGTSKGDCTKFIENSNEVANIIETDFSSFQTKRIFLDSYTQEVLSSGESYPLAKENLFSLINSGVFMINFTGHGSPEELTNEKIITRSDIVGLYNKKLPIFVTATCSFSRFDDTESSSGEELLMNTHGGSIGLFTTTRTVFLDQNSALNIVFNENAFKIENGKALTFGEIMRRTKNGRWGDENRLNFTLLADPAIILPIPTNKIEVSSFTSDANAGADTIQALSKVTIKGIVKDQSGNKLSQFNGIVYANILDKAANISSFGNNGCDPYKYKDWCNTLFSGRAQVTKGEFTVQFLVPKDIAYNYDIGRIIFYANNDSNKLEANGYYNNFMVGGTKSDFQFENNGPQISMRLNSSAFKNGSTVDPSSVLYADLSDENGINAGGNGIGHDITISLSNDPNNAITLNSYYETNLGDYKSGSLSYKLPTLETGEYSLRLKAWDILNNSNESLISFKVDDSKAPELQNCYAVPNPAVDHVRFVFKHNQPLSKLKMSVDIVNLNGEHLWNHSQTNYFEGNEAYIEWDLVAHNGKKIEKGLYLYRISIESEDDGIIASAANKLLVK